MDNHRATGYKSPQWHTSRSRMDNHRATGYKSPQWRTSRSCRGEWKLARNTCFAYTQSIPKRTPHHNPNHTRNADTRGRNAGELPLAPTLLVWTIIAQQTTNHRNDTHRVAVGASGSSPETHALPTRNAPRQRVPLVEGSVKWSGSRFTA